MGTQHFAGRILIGSLLILLLGSAQATLVLGIQTVPASELIDGQATTGLRTASLALNGTGQPLVAYQAIPGPGVHQLKLAQKAGGWTFETLVQGFNVGFSSGLILNGGTIQVGYGADDAVDYTWYDGEKWKYELIQGGPYWFDKISASLAPGDSRPRFSYARQGGVIYYAYYDGDAEKWQNETVDTGAQFADTHLVINHGTPEIVYTKSVDGQTTVMVARRTGDWQVEAVAPGLAAGFAVVGTQAAILLVHGGVLSYAVPSATPGKQGAVSGWRLQTIAEKVSGQGTAALAVDGRGRPHVIYNGETGLVHAVLDGFLWHEQPVVDEPASFVDLVVDSGGRAHIVFIGNGGLRYLISPAIEPGDLVSDKLEVTQAIQDLNNSVRLVAGKRTFVRFHVHSAEGVYPTTAQLTVQRGGSETILLPITGDETLSDVHINVRPEPDRKAKNQAFLFELPTSLTTGQVTLRAEVNPVLPWRGRDPLETDYDNNEVESTITFETVPPLNLVLYQVGYSKEGTNYVPDPVHLNKLADWMQRAYPVSEVRTWQRDYFYGVAEFKQVNNAMQMVEPSCRSVNAALFFKSVWDQLYSGAQNIPAGTHYYGMVDDGGGFMRGCAIDIPSLVASGPTGTTWGWDKDGSYGDWYGAHELGHTYGLPHAEFCGAGGGQPFPNPRGEISPVHAGDQAIYGFDSGDRTVLVPWWRELMTYCDWQWISDHTYKALMDTFQSVPRATTGDRRSIDQTDRLLVTGSIAADGTTKLNPLFVIPNAGDIQPSTPGVYALVLRGEAGNELARYPFTPTEGHMDSAPDEQLTPSQSRFWMINELVPFVANTAQLVVEGPTGVVAQVMAGLTPPTIVLVQPNGGETVNDTTVEVAWTASDQDNDRLSYMVQYSPDNGATWEVVAPRVDEQSTVINTANLPSGTQALFRVWASDGLHTTSDQSDAPFSVSNHAPSVEIVTPNQTIDVIVGQTVNLAGLANDVEAGSMAGSLLLWSSSRDGVLGQGTRLSVASLSIGQHTITMKADDGQGGVAEDTVQVTVLADPTLLPSVADKLIAEPTSLFFAPTSGVNRQPLSVTNRNRTTPIEWQAVTDVTWITLSADSGITPVSELAVTLDMGAWLTQPKSTGEITLTSPSLPGQSVVVPVEVAMDKETIFLPLIQN